MVRDIVGRVEDKSRIKRRRSDRRTQGWLCGKRMALVTGDTPKSVLLYGLV